MPMYIYVDELGRYANWPIRFGNYGQFATPLRRFANWMVSMRTNVTTNSNGRKTEYLCTFYG